MRAQEFLNPALMHTQEPIQAKPVAEPAHIQVVVMQPEPESDAEPDVKLNPGMRYGQDGKAKWSPPLQQQLDVMKDAVGPTMNDTTLDPCQVHTDPMQDVHQHTVHDGHVQTDAEPDALDVLKKLAALLPKQAPVGQ
jgi:hypothetical protein